MHRRQLNVGVPEEIYEALRVHAFTTRTNQQDIVTEALQIYLRENGADLQPPPVVIPGLREALESTAATLKGLAEQLAKL